MSRDLDRALHYHKISYWQPAIDAYDKVLVEHPDNLQVLGRRAEMYVMLGRTIEAQRDLMVVAPALGESKYWVNLALAISCQGNFEAALIAYDQAIELDPNNVYAHFNKGVCLERDLGILDAGVSHFQRALEIDPEFRVAYGGISFNQLKRGEFIEGWKNFEFRNWGRNVPRLPGLMWDGIKTDDQLIIVCEQGIGDSVQFLRYAVLAAVNGQKTAVFCPPEFKPLLSSLGNDIEILTHEQEIQEPYQWAYVMSMPRLLGTTVETIPSAKRYLRSSKEKLAEWKMRMRPYEKTFNIGICWHPGHPANPHVAARVIPLKLFADMAAIPGVRLFCLQKEEAAKERTEVDFEVIDLGGDPIAKHDLFMDNAALMDNLDLVISTDSAVLHMAGAVGTKVFAPIPKGSCWRWLIDREDTPWYPNMKLFRQKEIHTWPEVFPRITEAVRAECELKFSDPINKVAD